MNTAPIKVGDVVRADVRGHTFFAVVTGKQKGEVRVEPVCRGLSFRFLRPRQVVGHYRKSKASHD